MVYIGPDITGFYKVSPTIDTADSISGDAINVKGVPSGSSRAVVSYNDTVRDNYNIYIGSSVIYY